MESENKSLASALRDEVPQEPPKIPGRDAPGNEIVQKPKKQRPPLNEKQMAAIRINLAKGRAIRDEKRSKKKEETEIVKNELIIKKAKWLEASKEKLKKEILGDAAGIPSEMPCVPEKKKAMKKKVLYVEASSSEDEDEPSSPGASAPAMIRYKFC